MAWALILIILLFAFLGICTLIGLGTLLGSGRGKSSAVLSMMGGGLALLAFFFLISMLFFRARSSSELARQEASEKAGLVMEHIHQDSPSSQSYFEDADGEARTIEISTDTKADKVEQEVEPAAKEVHTAPPEWVHQPPRRVDNIYRTSVVSDPKLTREECDASLAEPILEKAQDYVDQLLGSGASQTIGLDVAEIREDVCKAEYIQKRMSKTVGVGEMKILHVLMEFDEPFRNRMRQRYRRAVVQQRMVMAGGGALSILMVLGSIFGYLQIDTATKGFYSGRLKLVTAAVILAVVLVGLSVLT